MHRVGEGRGRWKIKGGGGQWELDGIFMWSSRCTVQPCGRDEDAKGEDDGGDAGASDAPYLSPQLPDVVLQLSPLFNPP